MFAKSVNTILFLAVSAALSACSTPCDGPGRLCAPISSITSEAAPPPPQPQQIASAPPEADAAQTFSVPMPDQASAAPAVTSAAPMPRQADGAQRLALLLPLHSATLGPAAAAVRDGFMAAYEREPTGFIIHLIDSGDATPDVLAAYTQAQQENDLIVGPLARSAVDAVADSGLINKPTIALNRGSVGERTLPPHMLAIGLSIEEEARQVANWAAAEQPNSTALVVAASAPWQRRTADAFIDHWQQMGRSADSIQFQAESGALSDADLAQLRSRLQNTPPGLIFAALNANQARQLRVALGAEIEMYGTSSLNPGLERGQTEPQLNGVRILDLPWQVQPDHPVVAVYPRGADLADADLERLYALGIDAFRIARDIALHPEQRFTLDGVTGQLTVDYEQGGFERIEQGALYRDGVLQATPHSR